MNTSVLVKGRECELGEAASAIVRRLSVILDASESEIIDGMVRAFGDAESLHANFASYIAGDALNSYMEMRPLAAVSVGGGHFVQSFVEEDFEQNLEVLERRWRMNGGKALSFALRLAVEWFGPEIVNHQDEIPF